MYKGTLNILMVYSKFSPNFEVHNYIATTVKSSNLEFRMRSQYSDLSHERF